MSQPHETPRETHEPHAQAANTHAPAAPKRPRWKIAGGVLIAALVLGGIGYALYKNAKDKKERQDPSADEIRQAFENTPDPNAFNPNNSPFAGSGTSPQPTSTPVAANPQPSPSVQGEITYQPWNYQNDALGIQMTLGGEWSVDHGQTNGSRTVFQNSKTPGRLAYVEAYTAMGETLDGVEKILAGSPDVTAVQRTTVAGTPALRYTARTASKSGIAVVHNNRVYYFHGDLADATTLATVSFF